jgi:DNA-binding response OmpR family regulator
MMKVLIVEDDEGIAKSLKMNLSLSGYEILTAGSVSEGWMKYSTQPFDILLLDVGLPDGSGIELCKRVRETGNEIPILFLSARTDEETAVKAMNFGGDDYIRKPFGSEELKVRMERILTRSNQAKDLLKLGNLKIDFKKRAVSIQDKEVKLGPREFNILTLLAKKAGDAVSRETMIAHFSNDSEVYDRTIDSHISHLRKKLKDASNEVVQVVSVYGVGYRLKWE